MVGSEGTDKALVGNQDKPKASNSILSVKPKRESSVPFTNRVPKLRFNSIRDELPPPPIHESFSQIRNPPSGDAAEPAPLPPYMDPLDTVYDPKCIRCDPTLCKHINATLLHSANGIEEMARTAVDILTFPIPFTVPRKVKPFGRFKATILILITALGELRKIKPPTGQVGLEKSPALQEIIKTVEEIKELAKKWTLLSERFANWNHSEFISWIGLINGAVHANYYQITNGDYELYGERKAGLFPKDVNIQDWVSHLQGVNLDMGWAPGSFQIKPNTNFLELPWASQMEFIQEIAQFAKILLGESVAMMMACMERWETERFSFAIGKTIRLIRTEIAKMQLDPELLAPAGFNELTATIQVVNGRKLELVNVAYALKTETKILYKQMGYVEKFVKQMYAGRHPGGYQCLLSCTCCSLNTTELVRRIVGTEPWDLETFMPITPTLAHLL